MADIISYASYIPRHRLDGSAIKGALGLGGGRGSRSVACFDEDTTSLGVEAARRCWSFGDPAPDALHFATTAPAYADKTNAGAIHAALDLPREMLAADHIGSSRSGYAALLAAMGGGLAVLSDVRTGRPGSSDEAEGGDGAAALLFGEGPGAVARVLGRASRTEEFVDRWRVPGEPSSRTWEERFALESYLPLIRDAVIAAKRDAGVEQCDRVLVCSSHSRAAKIAEKELGGGGAFLTEQIGFVGAAHLGISIAAFLDEAEPGEIAVIVAAADGADALVIEATDALVQKRAPDSVNSQIARMRPVDYPAFLTWRGFLDREPPRRPPPERPSAPAITRGRSWKYALAGSRCGKCRHVNLPPQRVCVECGAVDRGETERLADRRARVVTYTIDRLAYSLAPPVIEVVVDFEGGGRLGCEMTEADPADVAVGNEVEMSFRRLYTAEGLHNYFWKARPARGALAD